MKRLRIAGIGILLRRSVLGASPAMFFKGMSVERCEALGSVAYNQLFSEPVIFERNAVARGDVGVGCGCWAAWTRSECGAGMSGSLCLVGGSCRGRRGGFPQMVCTGIHF